MTPDTDPWTPLEDRRLGRAALRRLLLEEVSPSEFDRTAYLAAGETDVSEGGDELSRAVARDSQVLDLSSSETGVVVFAGPGRALAVNPPFPVKESRTSDTFDAAPLLHMLEAEPLVGVVLLRLGHYAAGVVRGETIVASKSGSRYVKNRHRAGGTSQHRFARSRERLVRELFDKACEVARNVFSPYQKGMNHVFLGGEQHTLRAFVQRCRHLQTLENKTLKRRLQIDRPGQVALEKIAFEVWKSRVLTFDLGGEPPLNLHLRGGEAKSLPPVGEG